MDWEPQTGALWTVVNERDELGSDLCASMRTARRACPANSIRATFCTAGTMDAGLRFTCPKSLSGEVRHAVDNGRALQDLLVQAGPRYVKALKRARAGAAKRNKS
jgi:hypothetical protein